MTEAAVLDPPPAPATQDAPKSAPAVEALRPYRFTTANAREFGRLGQQRKKEAKARLIAERDAAIRIASENDIPPGYRGVRLVRVRAQLDALDAAIAKELAKARPDSKRIKELADAAKSLEEQERRLSGRANPGTERPEPAGEETSRGAQLLARTSTPGSSPANREAQE